MAHSAPAVSLSEYLRTTYRPDLEYLDGELKEKPVTGFPHGVVQVLVSEWFRTRRKDWGIKVAVETRTQVTNHRVRLPDVVVVAADERATGALRRPPLIAIEVLSPTDTYADLKSRAADLRAMGTANIWLIDPDLRTAEVWDGQSWQPHPEKLIRAVDSPMHLDLAWLWAELDD